MRAIGGAQRAYEIMVHHAAHRTLRGEPLGTKQFVQDFIATSKMDIDQARLLTLKAAWLMDTVGKKEARQEISMIKVVATQMYQNVCDRAIQTMGALGVSDDTPVAAMWRNGRSLRIADGPDEVHKEVIARRELRKYA
jgi:acyl-CoA dehydrogenase